jgi:UrcA family protein
MQHAFAWRTAVLAGLALIPALTLTATPALAQSTNSDVVVTRLDVHYHDLDLATAKGRARLEARLRRASAQVCGLADGTGLWRGDDAGQDCYNRALAQAHTALAAAQQPREVVTR